MSQHATASRHTGTLLPRYRRFFLAGQPVELWENPQQPFGCAFPDLEEYCLDARWDTLFNAIILACLARLNSDPEEPLDNAPPWAWVSAVDGSEDRGREGH